MFYVINNVITLSGIGTFTINYTHVDTASGCTGVAMRQVIVDACTGIQVQTAVSSIAIFPNPGNGRFYYTINSDLNTLTIEVSDIQGRVVYASHETGLTAGTTKPMDLNSLNNGMYLVKLSNGNNQHVQRLIIAH